CTGYPIKPNEKLIFTPPYINDCRIDTATPFGACTSTVIFPFKIVIQPSPGNTISVFGCSIRYDCFTSGGKDSNVSSLGGVSILPTCLSYKSSALLNFVRCKVIRFEK